MNPKRFQGSYSIQGFIVYGNRAPTFKGHLVLKVSETLSRLNPEWYKSKFSAGRISPGP